MKPRIVTLPQFTLESGRTLRDVPVAYHSWGRLNERGDNAVLVCHALTGYTDVEDWWPELLGPGRALDTDRDFVVCVNVPGSPYGSVSPLTMNPETGKPYGPDFPPVTLRDVVRLHKLLLDEIGVRQVRYAIGGSMGGMQVLEWAFFGDFVRGLVPIGVGGRHSAWCIAWSWTQRHAIELDPKFRDGHYAPDEGPDIGLGLARMIAMITYRSFVSFQERFGRGRTGADAPFDITSYLAHQGDKLVERFDANCYLSLVHTMDTHDMARDRGDYVEVLSRVEQPALVIGIDSDLLYPLDEQRELAEGMPNAELDVLKAAHGHDAFLIERDEVNDHVVDWRRRVLDVALAERR